MSQHAAGRRQDGCGQGSLMFNMLNYLPRTPYLGLRLQLRLLVLCPSPFREASLVHPRAIGDQRVMEHASAKNPVPYVALKL